MIGQVSLGSKGDRAEVLNLNAQMTSLPTALAIARVPLLRGGSQL